MTQPIQKPITHPGWCDPRICDTTDAALPLHGGTPVTYRVPYASDLELTVHLAQVHSRVGRPEPLHCQLEVAQTESSSILAAGWLDSNDLRIVAAILIGFADKIDGAGR